MPDIATCIRKLQQLRADVPKIAANEMVAFSLDTLRAQAWNGVPWAPRKPGTHRNLGRALLIDTGRGRRTIKATPTATGAELSAIDYMQAHNAGVHKTVTARSRKGRSFSRRMNLPKRQWTGVNAKQTERIEKIVATKISQALA